MLDNHYLPVLLMNEVNLTNGATGFMVSNHSMANISVECMGEIHSALVRSVPPHLSFDVEDMAMEADDFDLIFAQFKETRNATTERTGHNSGQDRSTTPALPPTTSPPV